MNPHTLVICLLFLTLFAPNRVSAQGRKPSAGGRFAIVIDERLAALRKTPQLNGKLIRRLGRGRMVAIRSQKASADGITFFLVNVTRRTHGWIQREAIVSPSRAGDDRSLLELIKRSEDFDRISRSRIFLDYFPRSSLRPEVLLLLADCAEEVAAKLTRSVARMMNKQLGDAPKFSYYLNFSGLDRYNRQGVTFVFDASTNCFHYDGAAWRELIRRYPKTPEAAQARNRLERKKAQMTQKKSNQC